MTATAPRRPRGLFWYVHGGSDALPTERFVKRSIADVGEEIGLVAATPPRAPVLVAHTAWAGSRPCAMHGRTLSPAWFC